MTIGKIYDLTAERNARSIPRVEWFKPAELPARAAAEATPPIAVIKHNSLMCFVTEKPPYAPYSFAVIGGAPLPIYAAQGPGKSE